MSEVYAIGIGPGAAEYLTPQAAEILEKCTVIAGYRTYLDLIPERLRGKKVIAGSMREELKRCREALDAALDGEIVGVVSSGDAGIYGMAGLLLELTEQEKYQSIEVIVVPGVTAATAAAALAGAPLMNDFAVVNLSDLMTPKDLIEKRLKLLAEGDFVTALYNPASSRRRELLEFAVEVYRRAGGNLPAALVHHIGRSGQKIEFARLDNFPFDTVDMSTLVILGNSKTILRDGRFYCRRGYREKQDFEL